MDAKKPWQDTASHGVHSKEFTDEGAAKTAFPGSGMHLTKAFLKLVRSGASLKIPSFHNDASIIQ
jgi:hypothetical protein